MSETRWLINYWVLRDDSIMWSYFLLYDKTLSFREGTQSYLWAGIALLVEKLATAWTVWGSNCGGARFGYWVFAGGKAAGAWHWPPTPSSAEVKERVKLYLCSPSGHLWPVIGWTLSLLSLVWKLQGVLCTVEEAAVYKHNWWCYRRSVSVPRSEIRMRWNPLAVYTQTCLSSAFWRQRKGLNARPSIRLNLRWNNLTCNIRTE